MFKIGDKVRVVGKVEDNLAPWIEEMDALFENKSEGEVYHTFSFGNEARNETWVRFSDGLCIAFLGECLELVEEGSENV